MKQENDRLRAALTDIATQLKSAEAPEEVKEAGCYEEGWDELIRIAREALKDNNKEN